MCCTQQLAERSLGWRRVGRASAEVRRKRIIGRDHLEGCETNGKGGLGVVTIQFHLSL